MECIIEKFPRWQAEIEQLFQENADFQELCQDYEEVSCLLATLAASAEPHSETIEGYQTLLKELDVEIMEALQARFQHTEPPEHDSAT